MKKLAIFFHWVRDVEASQLRTKHLETSQITLISRQIRKIRKIRNKYFNLSHRIKSQSANEFNWQIVLMSHKSSSFVNDLTRNENKKYNGSN